MSAELYRQCLVYVSRSEHSEMLQLILRLLLCIAISHQDALSHIWTKYRWEAMVTRGRSIYRIMLMMMPLAGGVSIRAPLPVRETMDLPDRADEIAMPDSPCNPQSGKVAFGASSDSNAKCLDSNPILYTPSVSCTCPGADQVCIRPLQSERILRIRLDDGSTGNGQVVLWQGDRSLVMRDVKVGREGARFLGPVVRWGTIFTE
jgi:hypothetical protein